MHSRTAKHTAEEVNGILGRQLANSQLSVPSLGQGSVVGEGRKAKKGGETAKKSAPHELLGLKRNKPLNMMYLGWLLTFVEGETGQS